jgi:intraflagellar transport protein 74
LLEQEQQAKNKDSKSETEKYELLLNKDREIDEFFNKFDDEKQREETEVATLQDKIEQTLEELSEVSSMAENLPDEAKAKDIIGEHEFKNQALSDAKFTLEKLKIERDKLRKEMVKYEHIDKRLASEIEMNQQRIQQMSSEITDKFERVNDIKHGIEQRVEQYKLKKEFLNKKRE